MSVKRLRTWKFIILHYHLHIDKTIGFILIDNVYSRTYIKKDHESSAKTILLITLKETKTMEFFLIIIVVFIILGTIGSKANAKKTEIFEKKYTMSQEVQHTLTDKKIDASVIDVSGDAVKIPPAHFSNNAEVPHWPHFYVYSHKALDDASADQRSFYAYFKSNFLKGNYLELFGNNNYAFILLFDLLNEYEVEPSLDPLHVYLKALAENYPKTRSYCKTFLIQKLQKRGDTKGISRVYGEFGMLNNASEYDNSFYRLGTRYKSKLNLTPDQEKWLNFIWDPGNNFCSIEFCLLETIKLYLLLIEQFDAALKEESSSFLKQIETISDIVATKQFRYKKGSFNYMYNMISTTESLYRLLFRYSENALREHYGHKRKVTTDFNYKGEVKNLWDAKILSRLDAFIKLSLPKLQMPDELTELSLNAQNTGRWKFSFEKIKEEYGTDGKKFLKEIEKLGKVNKKNPSIENIFFEASKFIAKSDRETSLSLYIHYLYHDLQSASFDNKPLTKTIQKSLFRNNEELKEFEKLVSDLIKEKDLQKALQSVGNVYVPKRKKISLDAAVITEVHQKHSTTVSLLDEILGDEYVDDITTIKSSVVNDEEVKITITQKATSPVPLQVTNAVNLSPVHVELLELFAKHSFIISDQEIEIFARSKGVFKNGLIEGVNDCCYEHLDDLLIEEEDDNYIVNENSYQSVLNT